MKKCQILTSNVVSSTIPYYKFTNKEYQDKIGNNTGNVLICDYGTRTLNYDFIYSPYWNEETDEYLILAANDLRPGYNIDYNIWFNFLNRLQKPLNIIGLGTQAVLEEMKPAEYIKTLSDNMIKWIKLIADKCNSIGVRGEFTADVLKHLGITNVDVIGCPTWFVNGYNQPLIRKKNWSTNLKPAFYTCWEPYSEWHVAWHNAIAVNMLKLKNAKFVIQSEFNFVPYMLANKDLLQFLSNFSMEEYKSSLMAVRKHFGFSDYDVQQDKDIKNMFEIFSDIREWENFIKTRDFSFGFRIHGSIIALKNGVPAICVVSDSRMYELCSVFKIPFVTVQQISSEELSVEKIYNEADFSEMNKKYSNLLKNYISFLDKNNIVHKF